MEKNKKNERERRPRQQTCVVCVWGGRKEVRRRGADRGGLEEINTEN